MTKGKKYYGINKSDIKQDYDVCAFGTTVGEGNNKILIYLKYGLEEEGVTFTNQQVSQNLKACKKAYLQAIS